MVHIFYSDNCSCQAKFLMTLLATIDIGYSVVSFSYIFFLKDPDGVEVEAIKPLAWYPENLAWHSNYSRMQLRKNQNLER